MTPKYTQETIENILGTIKDGHPVRLISKASGIPESTIRGWIKRSRPETAQDATQGEDALDVQPATENATEPMTDAPTTPAGWDAIEPDNATETPEDTSDASNPAESIASETTPEPVATDDAPSIPIRLGDAREWIIHDGPWILGYPILNMWDACLSLRASSRCSHFNRITRDGVPVSVPSTIGLTQAFHPTLYAFRLDDFSFGSCGEHRGYQVAIDSEGIIREYRCNAIEDRSGRTLPENDMISFSECFGDLPCLILDYVARYLPIVYAQPIQIPTRPSVTPAVSTETHDDSADDDDSDDDSGDSITCDDCDCELTENTARTVDDETYCESCFYDHYEVCNHCGTTVPSDESQAVDGDIWCDNCHSDHFTTCYRCDDSTPNEDTLETANGRTICRHCYENNYFRCDDCDEIYPDDRMNSTDDGYYCDDCYPDHSSDLIRDYSNKSADKMTKLGSPRDKLYFGVELEVCARHYDARNESAEDVLSALGEDYCVLKEDGSLPSGGFEIVTCPATLAIHADRFRRLMVDHPIRGLKSWDASNCGMHVHASKNGVSPLTIGKLLVFVNDDRHQDFITTIAGRDANTYCQRFKKKITDARPRRWDRYEAINLTNPHTIEFRIFKGTLKYDSFMKNLEFVSASIAFCRLAGCQELNVRAFCDFLEAYKLTYPNLYAFLAAKGYVKPSKRVESALAGVSAVGAEV